MTDFFHLLLVYIMSAFASGWAEWALAQPEFGSSVNPITTRGTDYAHRITVSELDGGHITTPELELG